MKKLAMQKENSLKNSLIDMEDSILVVIDVQVSFLEKFPDLERELLINRIGWLVDVATRLNIPLVVTAEEIPVMGSVAPVIAKKFPKDTHIYNKMIFGLASDPEILKEVKNTGRKTAILIGLETDVCVAHSAIGLLENGYKVAVVEDATGSPGLAHQVGIERMRGAGVLITSVKGVFYEWLRTVQNAVEFSRKYDQEIGQPKDIIL